jgi:uncharacterized protein with PIN domain/sulfur carrier protein ThiS
MPHTVDIRFYGELNDFLAPDLHGQTFAVSSPEARSVKDLIEAQGVPHSEVDLILVNGESVGFEQVVRDGDRVSVYPKFEALNIQAVSRLGRPPLRHCRFIADVHLGKLVRRLRLLGFDCLFDPAWADPELARRSAADERVLLTRDRGLLMRSTVTHGVFVRSGDADEQVREVLRRLDLAAAIRPFTRCIRCNGALTVVPKAAVQDRVPPFTYQTIAEFVRCADCQTVYWKGTHWPRLEKLIAGAVTAPA